MSLKELNAINTLAYKPVKTGWENFHEMMETHRVESGRLYNRLCTLREHINMNEIHRIATIFQQCTTSTV